jgi:hypothetical protein
MPLYRLSESDFLLRLIHAPIKADIGQDRFRACADLVAVRPPHLGVETRPL